MPELVPVIRTCAMASSPFGRPYAAWGARVKIGGSAVGARASPLARPRGSRYDRRGMMPALLLALLAPSQPEAEARISPDGKDAPAGDVGRGRGEGAGFQALFD